MNARKPLSPLAAAIAAARDFKELLDIQAPDTLSFPKHKGDARTTATYATALRLLDQAVTQDAEGAKGISFERRSELLVTRVVANNGADVPANQFELFAGITAAIAQLAFEVLDESGGGTKHSGLLEIAVRFRGQFDQVGELVESKVNVVHGTGLQKKVIEEALCHGAAAGDEVRQ